MKQRVISAVVASMIVIPLLLLGGVYFGIGAYILTLIGLREFMKVKGEEKKYPNFIRLLSYLMISFVYFQNTVSGSADSFISYRLVAGVFLTLLLPVVFYHDEKIYDVKDAFYLLGGIFFLGYSMSLLTVYRNMGLEYVIFLFLITIITDSYAYFVGMLIGKNKLLEEISPKKTWEGSIGGSLVATFVCTTYYLTVIDKSASILQISLIVLFLSIVGQFGDLLFSAIKRKFKVKDFSNIMPGHGGILDRLDSIIFVMLAFTFFLKLL